MYKLFAIDSHLHWLGCKILAPGEDRTHDLKIMRLTRCLLRYRGPRKVLGSAFDRESSDLSIYIRKHE